MIAQTLSDIIIYFIIEQIVCLRAMNSRNLLVEVEDIIINYFSPSGYLEYFAIRLMDFDPQGLSFIASSRSYLAPRKQVRSLPLELPLSPRTARRLDSSRSNPSK